MGRRAARSQRVGRAVARPFGHGGRRQAALSAGRVAGDAGRRARGLLDGLEHPAPPFAGALRAGRRHRPRPQHHLHSIFGLVHRRTRGAAHCQRALPPGASRERRLLRAHPSAGGGPPATRGPRCPAWVVAAGSRRCADVELREGRNLVDRRHRRSGGFRGSGGHLPAASVGSEEARRLGWEQWHLRDGAMEALATRPAAARRDGGGRVRREQVSMRTCVGTVGTRTTNGACRRAWRRSLHVVPSWPPASRSAACSVFGRRCRNIARTLHAPSEAGDT